MQVADLGLTGNGYLGLAVYEERRSTAEVGVGNQGNLNIVGTVYAAGAPFLVAGRGSLNLMGDAAKDFGAHLLAADLTVSDNGSVSIDTSDNHLEPFGTSSGSEASAVAPFATGFGSLPATNAFWANVSGRAAPLDRGGLPLDLSRSLAAATLRRTTDLQGQAIYENHARDRAFEWIDAF
jgi:hypothetical protein